MKKFAFAFLLLVFQYGLHAQTRADSLPTTATLEQCIRFALDHQPDVAQATLGEQITAANIRSRLADWFPQIGAGYSFTHNFQRQTSFFNGIATPIGVNNTSTAQLYLDQTIFNRDVLLANRTQGDVRLQSRQVTAATRIDVVANVSKAFYDILTTQQQIKVATENIARLQRSLNDAYYRYQAGVTDKTDYKRAQIALNNTTALKQSAEASIVAKTENLKALMGFPPTDSLKVTYDSAQLERDAAFDTLQVLQPTRRIEYQQLLTEKRLREAQVLYERHSFLPNVSATAGYNLNYLNNNFGKLYNANYPNSFAGLTAGIPIFQGGRRRSNIRAAQLEEARTDVAITGLQNDINNQYASALSNYKSSFSNYRASKENVSLAQEVYDVIQLQYRSGIKTYLEVISAETDLRTAQINYFNTLYQLLASKVDALRALGLVDGR